MKIGWADLVGYSNWYPPYVYGDLPESEKSWLSINDSQKVLYLIVGIKYGKV